MADEQRPTHAPIGRDVIAGLVAALVVLPQSMAFGVAVFGPTLGPGAGALAGLVGAAALSLSSGALGGTAGLISAPTGPVLALLGGTLASAAVADLPTADLLAAIAVVVALSGVTQAIIGAVGGGNLVKLLPYPVVAGFMTGAAVLMIESQRDLVAEPTDDGAWIVRLGLPALTAAAAFAAAQIGPKLVAKVPGPVLGLIVGTLVFHLGTAISGPVDDRWLVGALPGPGDLSLPLLHLNPAALPWPRLVGDGLALGLLAALDTLLTAVIADTLSGQRHAARRELIGQGIGQMLAAFGGGLAGAGTTGATVAVVNSGGRRWAGIACGVGLALLVVVGGPVGAVLPVPALGGILLAIAVGMLDRDLLAWWRHRRSRLDAAMATVVVVVTVAVDLMVAVGAGVLIAIFLHLREQARTPIVRARDTAVQRHSVVRRPSNQRALLDEHGDRVVVATLRGDLYFATADRLVGELGPDLDHADVLILDLRGVLHMDLTGVKLLGQMIDRMHQRGAELVVAELHKGAGVGRKLKKALSKVSSGEVPKVRTFIDVDEALAWAEEQLLDEVGDSHARPPRVALEQSDLCTDMDADDVEALRSVCELRRVHRGDQLFDVGEDGEGLHIVIEGEVDIRLPTTHKHYRRLARCGPGTTFGEIAFLHPGPRTAQAVAATHSELLVLGRPAFEALREQYPHAAQAVLLAIARRQGDMLRRSTQELKRLGSW
jgi:SulP family sulfate permease